MDPAKNYLGTRLSLITDHESLNQITILKGEPKGDSEIRISVIIPS